MNLMHIMNKSLKMVELMVIINKVRTIIMVNKDWDLINNKIKNSNKIIMIIKDLKIRVIHINYMMRIIRKIKIIIRSLIIIIKTMITRIKI